MRPKILIWGASGQALVVVDILRQCGEFEIAGLLDDVNPQRHGTVVCGLPVLGGRECLAELKRQGVGHLILGFGDCQARAKLAAFLTESGFQFAKAVHPRAIVAGDVRIGDGTVVAAGAVINPGARVGTHCIINSASSVDHECVIGDAVHLSPGVHLGGLVEVGDATWIGIGASVRDRIRIGARSIIGAGAVIIRDVPDDVVIYGVPGRMIRSTAEQAIRQRNNHIARPA